MHTGQQHWSFILKFCTQYTTLTPNAYDTQLSQDSIGQPLKFWNYQPMRQRSFHQSWLNKCKIEICQMYVIPENMHTSLVCSLSHWETTSGVASGSFYFGGHISDLCCLWQCWQIQSESSIPRARRFMASWTWCGPAWPTFLLLLRWHILHGSHSFPGWRILP